jgi:mannose-6-phosphate isomerase-like protein (cupin superfamily)
MTFNSDTSTFLDKEQEALWYLGGQRIINALGERIEVAFRLTEFVTPAGTLVYAQMHKEEDEAIYVIEGEATMTCGGQVFHVSAGTFLFLPSNEPHHLEISKSGPLRYLTWMTPAGFAHDVTKMGNPNTALLLAPPLAPDRAKVQQLANLLVNALRSEQVWPSHVRNCPGMVSTGTKSPGKSAPHQVYFLPNVSIASLIEGLTNRQKSLVAKSVSQHLSHILARQRMLGAE